VVFEGVIAGVVPLELQSKIDRQPLDGLLGYSLFSDLYFALDYPNHRLVLSKSWPKNLPPVRAQLPITERSGVPFVPITVQGKPFEVMVDTGANDSFHLPPAAVKALTWKVAPRPGFMLAVAGGTSREHIARLAGALALGPLRQKQPVVGLSEGPATIGLGLLHSSCLVFHEDEEKLWLCSTQKKLPLAAPVRTVGLSLFADPAGWQVAGIIPHSPAEAAGIGEGDLVTAIEGRPARAWTPDQIQGWIDTHPALAIYLSAPSGERELSLPVWLLMP
jgi:Aspartyl protease/PDZ domain